MESLNFNSRLAKLICGATLIGTVCFAVAVHEQVLENRKQIRKYLGTYGRPVEVSGVNVFGISENIVLTESSIEPLGTQTALHDWIFAASQVAGFRRRANGWSNEEDLRSR